MSTWTMAWGDGDEPGALSAEEWSPRPVGRGAVQVVRVVLEGFHGVPAEPVLVAWDDSRATVRLANGELRWYADRARFAFPQDDQITVADATSLYPRGNRFMDALAVRSLQDLMETVNADTVTSIDADGAIHLDGEDDHSRARARRDPESGIVLLASGVEGHHPWRLEVLASRVLGDADALLEPAHSAPPAM